MTPTLTLYRIGKPFVASGRRWVAVDDADRIVYRGRTSDGKHTTAKAALAHLGMSAANVKIGYSRNTYTEGELETMLRARDAIRAPAP